MLNDQATPDNDTARCLMDKCQQPYTYSFYAEEQGYPSPAISLNGSFISGINWIYKVAYAYTRINLKDMTDDDIQNYLKECLKNG